MRILIAESKTMAECTSPVSAEVLRQHTPRLDSIATLFMKDWGEWPVDKLAATLKISQSLAAGFKRMAYEFPNKATGCKALDAFTGVVFRAFRYSSLTQEEKERAGRHINIISSLYGWLRGDDIVKSYRLDFTTRIAPTGQSMAGYWKRLITPMLLESMRMDGETEILDLMPSDAAKCLDRQWIRRAFNIVKVEFQSICDGGSLKTPHATMLKSLRGRLLRDIIQKDIRSVADLMCYESTDMAVDPASDPVEGKITILC